MGAVNYKTSDFITLGYNINNIDYEDELYYLSVNDEYDYINALLRDSFPRTNSCSVMPSFLNFLTSFTIASTA